MGNTTGTPGDWRGDDRGRETEQEPNNDRNPKK